MFVVVCGVEVDTSGDRQKFRVVCSRSPLCSDSFLFSLHSSIQSWMSKLPEKILLNTEIFVHSIEKYINCQKWHPIR